MKDIAIIGGGLAGLTAAIHLRQLGLEVVVFEKKKYPHHKVCGEYISKEVIPYFDRLGVEVKEAQPNEINRFQLHAPSGKKVEAQLSLGGVGIRRYTLDNLLYETAKDKGCIFFLETTVQDIIQANDGSFLIKSNKQADTKSKVVLGSFGKRSVLDKSLQRPFVQIPSDYVGLKYYLEKDFPSDLVTLYNFDGGYCGAVQVEDQTVDVALLVRKDRFKAFKNLETFETQALFPNKAIANLFQAETRTLKRPLAISNVSFLPKHQVHNGILMIGDAAGMIPPLAGNGMAMGIHAAKIAAETTSDYLFGRISRVQMEKFYQQKWRKAFGQRLYWGRWLHYFMGKPLISEFSVKALQNIPFILPPIIRQTHGKPL